MRMRTKFSIPLLLAALVAVLPGCGQNKQASGQAPGGPTEVTVVTIAPAPVTLTTILPGRTSAYLMSDVRPQVGGIVQKRLFKEGAEVKVGETLYQIDPATYQAAYDSARATLVRAEANALPARLKAERYARLVKVNGVSQQDNDDAQASFRQTEAEVVAAKATLQSAHINLGYTRVTSPISGRIGKSSVTPGALVTASQATALATVQQTDPIYVDVTQSSTEVMRLKRDLASGKLKKAGSAGAKVRLIFDDGTAYPLEGVLQFSDITVDQNTGVVTLRALFPNPNHDILPGLYVRAMLDEGVEEQALLVPQAAVSRDNKGQAQVLVVKDDGTVEQRAIEVSRVIGGNWLVAAGLAAGDKVIVEGLQKVRPGAKVKPVEASAPGAAPAADNATAPQPSPVKSEPVKSEMAKPAPQATQQPTPTKPEAAKQAPAQPAKAAETSQPQPAQMKPQQASAPAPKPEAQPAAKEAQTPAKAPAKKRDAMVYSPAKNEPWPTSSLTDAPASATAKPAEHNTAQQ